MIQEAQSLPFFGDQRLIFCGAAFFLTAEKANVPEHDLDDFLLYLKNPMDTAFVLVIFAEYDKLDERKKITKQLKKQGSSSMWHQ